MRHSFGRPYLYQKPYMAFLQGLIDSIGYVFFKTSGKRPQDVKKILVSRIDHMGDVFLASSVLPHLKKAYPEAEIDFMAGSWSTPCLKGNPYLNKIVVFDAFKHDRRPGMLIKMSKAISVFLKTVKEMRKEPYDLCLVLRAYPFNGIVMSRLGGCKNIAGFSTGGFGFLLNQTVPYRDNVHELAHLADALDAVGVKCGEKDLNPSFSASKEASYKWALMKNGHGIGDNEPYVLMHTGSGNPKKYWKKESWQGLIDSIAAEIGYKVLVYDTVYGDLNGCIKMDTLISFDAFAAAVKGATAFVGLDSLPGHLAASFGVPAVVVWCGMNDPVKWRPVGVRVAVVKKDIPCAPCSLKNGCAGMPCMDISSEECFEQVKFFLRPANHKGSVS